MRFGVQNSWSGLGNDELLHLELSTFMGAVKINQSIDGNPVNKDQGLYLNSVSFLNAIIHLFPDEVIGDENKM